MKACGSHHLEADHLSRTRQNVWALASKLRATGSGAV